MDQGAPLDYVILEPVLGSETFIGLSSEAPHPNAGRLFVDFLLSDAGQVASVPEFEFSPTGAAGVALPEQ